MSQSSIFSDIESWKQWTSLQTNSFLGVIPKILIRILNLTNSFLKHQEHIYFTEHSSWLLANLKLRLTTNNTLKQISNVNVKHG